MQNEITKPTDLLNQDGNIVEPGFAKKMLYNYNRENITAKKTRLKEWDYYYISNKEFALCLTISDMGFVGALSLTVMDFVTPAQFTNSAICLFPMGKFNMPRTSEKGDCSWKIGKVEMKFENDGEKRHLTGVYPNADKFGTDVKWDIVISEVPEESMVIATPFNKKGHFYFNQKINCMKAEGSFFLGDKECKFDGADSLATLDWGRGVWDHKNYWFWGNGTTYIDGKLFGFEITWGIGAPEKGRETALMYDGKCHKLGEVYLEYQPDKRWMDPWKFHEENGRFELTMTPFYDNITQMRVLFIGNICHQVFGKWNGTMTLDDGTVVEIKDMVAFCENSDNMW